MMDDVLARRYEQAHYRLQLPGYFSALREEAGFRLAFTDLFTDVWYNQAYDLDPSIFVGAPDRLASLIQFHKDHDRIPCFYLRSTQKIFVEEARISSFDFKPFENELWMFAASKDLAALNVPQEVEVKKFDPQNQNLLQDFEKVYCEGLPGPEVEQYIKAALLPFQNQSSDFDINYLIAYIRSAPVGILCYLAKGEYAGIYAVATIPAARGKGVAKALLCHAAERAQRNRIPEVFLQTVEGGASEKIFSQLGFVTKFSRKGFVPTSFIETLTHG